ncbi:MAG: hypothetical protein P9L99_08110 [Candidatus Lernaella stagnicola]|nr:hypothetical protein [Candidatus Lernaella stagnicola]
MKPGWIVFIVVSLVIIAVIAWAGIRNVESGREFENDDELAVLLAYNPKMMEKYGYILDAYESVLAEEGVPSRRFSLEELFNTDPEVVVKTKPVLIFPDSVNQEVPIDIRFWIYPYIQAGGNVAIIYDAGVKNRKGFYRAKSPFSDILGINYVTYDDLETASYTYGHVEFADEDKRNYMEIPFGKVGPDGVLSSYSYGELTYPVARIKELAPLTYDEVYGKVVMSKDEKYPAVVIRNHGNGSVLYVNLPLGFLKSYSDDLPLRSVLRVFLFKEVGFPHLVNLPFNKPGLVLNWHIDDYTEWETMPRMIEDGMMKPIMEYSIHITAGEFVETPGDELGFDACGKGRPVVDKFKSFGVLGSHGGWAHNWFSDNINAGLFTQAEMERYIVVNSDCIESISGEKVVEYSAPNGAFPQPESNELMEKLGILAYYNTADSGSFPNRTFVAGKMATDRAISFPVMPYYQAASLYEIGFVFNYQPDEIKKWFVDTFDYVVENRTIRMMYTHPYDIYLYLVDDQRTVIKESMDILEEMQKSGQLQVRSMSYFAKYMLRFLDTQYSFRVQGDKLIIELKNEKSLQGIPIALPRDQYSFVDDGTFYVHREGRYEYVIIGEDVDEKTLVAKRR